jgi:ketosteroid isomerase-like protein
MTQETAEVVKRFNDLFWRGTDVGAALDLVDPDAEFDWSNSRAPYSGFYRGHAAVREARKIVDEAWEEFEFAFEETIGVDSGTVVLVTTVHARGKGSGVPVRAEGASVWRVQDGRIVGAKLFQSKAEALAAVGIEQT